MSHGRGRIGDTPLPGDAQGAVGAPVHGSRLRSRHRKVDSPNQQRLLDPLDQRLLELLREDLRLPIVRIAERLGIAPATARRRLERLTGSGVVQFVTAVDPGRFGYQVSAMIGLQIDLKKADPVSTGLAQLEEVTYASAVTGSFDFIITTVFRTEDELYDFLTRRLASIDGVQRTETFRVLKVVKRTANWGVAQDGSQLESGPSRLEGDIGTR